MEKKNRSRCRAATTLYGWADSCTPVAAPGRPGHRNAEIGLLMALGEQPASVVWMVMREAAEMLTPALGRLIAAQLFGPQATDARTYVSPRLHFLVE